jgi:xylulokinase
MLADITGRTIETVESPQNVGSVGAAAVVAVGLGLIPDLESVKSFIPASAIYRPDKEKHKKYGPYYRTFKKLYTANRNLFRAVAK